MAPDLTKQVRCFAKTDVPATRQLISATYRRVWPTQEKVLRLPREGRTQQCFINIIQNKTASRCGKSKGMCTKETSYFAEMFSGADC
jgi:hypothetical protein